MRAGSSAGFGRSGSRRRAVRTPEPTALAERFGTAVGAALPHERAMFGATGQEHDASDRPTPRRVAQRSLASRPGFGRHATSCLNGDSRQLPVACRWREDRSWHGTGHEIAIRPALRHQVVEWSSYEPDHSTVSRAADAAERRRMSPSRQTERGSSPSSEPQATLPSQDCSAPGTRPSRQVVWRFSASRASSGTGTTIRSAPPNTSAPLR